MKHFYKSLDAFSSSLRGGAVAVGNFDGVHLGHRKLVEQLRQLADYVHGPAVVLTFDPPPAALLYPDSVPPALTWMERRATLLHQLGVDVVLACPTTHELLKMEPEEFYSSILRERIGAKAFVEGPNFRFGRERRGDIRLLEQLAKRDGCELSIVLAETSQGSMLSSSRIRALLKQGELDEANAMLVEPYRMLGRVERGAGRGSGIGFPTANVAELKVMAPALGVYGGRAWVAGKPYLAAINLGTNPTFGESHVKLEVHLLDFEGDLYGQELELELRIRIRETRRFESVDQLRNQLENDLAQLRKQVAV